MVAIPPLNILPLIQKFLSHPNTPPPPSETSTIHQLLSFSSPPNNSCPRSKTTPVLGLSSGSRKARTCETCPSLASANEKSLSAIETPMKRKNSLYGREHQKTESTGLRRCCYLVSNRYLNKTAHPSPRHNTALHQMQRKECAVECAKIMDSSTLLKSATNQRLNAYVDNVPHFSINMDSHSNSSSSVSPRELQPSEALPCSRKSSARETAPLQVIVAA